MTNKFTLRIQFILLTFIVGLSPAFSQVYTFTNAGATGTTGPTQTQVTAAYASTSLAGNVTVTAGIQKWQVPVAGLYKIEVYGANGYGPFAGRGAYMKGEFNFNSNDELKILVGQQGGCCVGSGTEQFGGGGGTFVVSSTNTAIIVAGGGGGANGNSSILPNSDASITTSGNTGVGTSGGAGGTNGAGGGGVSSAGGGGGFTGDGGATAGIPGGFAFLNGGEGGTSSTSGGWGGFGGGGGANSYNNRRGGGGGGYSGGGGAGSGTSSSEVGGGGGSFNSGNNQVNTAGLGAGHGLVVITLLSPAVSVPDDVGSVGFPSLAGGICPGNQTVSVRVRNFGNNAVDSFKVAWEVNGILQSNNWYSYPLDTFPVPNYDTILVLGTYNFGPGSYDVKAWTSLPNNQNDTVNINDTTSTTLITQLSGTYTINSALVTGGTNYQSFADFTDALNIYGICGPVIANVSGGPFTEAVHIGDIAGSSAINTIKINGNGAIVQFNNTSTDRQLLTLSGSKFVTIDSLNFKTLATDYGWAALITGGSSHDSIINCNFDLTSVTSTGSANIAGITFSGSSTSATTTGTNGSNCYIGNNHVKGSDGLGGPYYALVVAGSSDSNVIENNIFENYYYYGAYVNGAAGAKIRNNEFHKENKTGSLTTFYGIYTTGITPGLEITGNRIHHPGGLNGGTGTLYGIYSLGDGTAAYPNLIANNVLYHLNQSGLMYGIYLSTAPYTSVYHNTVVIDQPSTSSSTTYGLYATGTNTDVEFKNNNVVITEGSTGIKYGFYYSTSASIEDAQKNNIYVNSTQPGVQNYGYYATAYTTQAAFQAANPTLEIGSPAVDPMFVNPLTGDFHVQSSQLIGNGENLLALVPEDIEGTPRSSAPTIGAFESEPTAINDAAISSFVTPAGTFCSGQESVSVSIYNAGINNINNVQVHWELDGVAQPTINYTGTLVPITATSGQNADTVVLGNVTFLAGNPMTIKAWTSLPNNLADTANLNDTIQATYQTSLSGVYTVNSALATGGTNYQTFSDLSADLNTYGICGPVVVNVSGGPFLEPVIFDDISGSSAVNTIRINGGGAVVQFANTTTDRQLLTLNGTKYITIDSLNFKTLSTDYGWAALITNGAAYDSIKNCNFDLSSVTSISSVNVSGIVFSSSNTSATSAGSNGSHCYIGNNHVKGADGTGGPYYGVALAGDCDSNVIENNIIENFYFYGLRISDGTGNKILNNEFHKANKTASFSTFYGMYTTGTNPGLEINGNRIHHPGGVTGYSGTFYGIYALGDGTSADPIVIANNAFYHLNYDGIIRGLYLSTAPYNLVYHNTIVIDQINSGSSIQYGIYATGTNTGSEIINNNISITGGSTGTKYGFYYATATSIDDAQKNNFYLNSSQPGTQNYGYYTADYATKAAFQTAYPALEVGSPDAAPMFFNPAGGDFNVQSPALIGNGVNLTAIVPTDINGNTRITSPTIGAFEQAPAGSNNAGSYAFISPKGTYCAGPQSVSLSIKNAGTNDITNVEIHWTVNGIAQPVVNYTDTLVTLTATSGQNMDTVVLGNANIPSGTPTIIKAWTSLPNGIADVENANDTISLSFEASEFFITTGTDTLCSGKDIVLHLHPDNGYQTGDITWQSSLNGTTWTDIPNSDDVTYGETNLTTDKWFRVKIGAINSCFTDSLKVTIIDAVVLSTTDDERCGPGILTLGATGSGGTTLNWYAEETGGTEIGVGNSFTTPFLNETDTFYVSAGLGSGSGAQDTLSSLNGGGNSCGGGVMFDIVGITNVNIDSFKAIAASSGSIIKVYVRNGTYLGNGTNAAAWTLHETFNQNYTTGEVMINLTNPIPITSGDTTGIYIMYYANYANGTAANQTVTTPDITMKAGYGLCSEFGGLNDPRIFNGVIYYGGSGCESPRQQVIAHVRPFPDVDMGADIDECVDIGSSISLDAGTYPDNPTYLWEDNTTGQTRQVSTSGDYSVIVTNEFGCSGSDTVNVQLKLNPEVDLGNDTTICEGITLLLNAGYQGISYFWSTGATTPTITVTQTGTYNVVVTNMDGCVGQDTIHVQTGGVLPSSDGIYVVNLGPKTFKFQADNAVNDMVYDWDFGDGSVHSASPNPTHTYASVGNYLVKLKILGSCGSLVDSIYISIVGIDDLQNDSKKVKIYPNPTTGKATIISLGNLGMEKITIFNTLGQQVFIQNVSKTKQIEIDLNGLASGLYNVHIQTDKGNITRKLEVLK